jgi:hypothetical protein
VYSLDHLICHVFVVAVNNHSLKSPAGQFLDSRISVGAKFSRNFQVAQDSPQYPKDFVVGTKNQRLQIHLSRTPLNIISRQ